MFNEVCPSTPSLDCYPNYSNVCLGYPLPPSCADIICTCPLISLSLSWLNSALPLPLKWDPCIPRALTFGGLRIPASGFTSAPDFHSFRVSPKFQAEFRLSFNFWLKWLIRVQGSLNHCLKINPIGTLQVCCLVIRKFRYMAKSNLWSLLWWTPLASYTFDGRLLLYDQFLLHKTEDHISHIQCNSCSQSECSLKIRAKRGMSSY